MHQRTTQGFNALAYIVLIIIAISRILNAGAARFNHDEVRSISRALGTPGQIIAWQPNDWPPLYYLFLAGWQGLTGIDPFTLRYSGVLFFLIGAALTYRLGKRLFRNGMTALLAMSTYAAVGMYLFLSVHLRGYAMILMLYPLAFDSMIRTFEADPRRWWRWAALTGVTMSVMFYTTYSSALAFVPMLLFSFIMYPRRWWRWFLVGGVAVVTVFPQFIDFYRDMAASREGGAGNWFASWFILPDVPPAKFVEFIHDRFMMQVVRPFLFWALITLTALIVLIYRERGLKRLSLAIVLWGVGGTLFAASWGITYGMMNAQYWWYLTLGLVLVIAHGLSYLSRWITLPLVGAMLWISFMPMPQPQLWLGRTYYPFEDVFSYLANVYQPGDVMVIDPNCLIQDPFGPGACGTPEEWDYYQMRYFSRGRLYIVDDPTGYRRVWYVHQIDNEDPATQQSIAQGRLKSTFAGPANFFFQLYEGPPDAEGVLYENGMRFHGADIIDPYLNDGLNRGFLVRREGQSLRIRLWWSIDAPTNMDYSVSLQLAQEIDTPALAQQDGAPTLIHLQPYITDPLPTGTSSWEPGQIYVEERTLTLPYNIPGSFMYEDSALYVTVYQWWDGAPIMGENTATNGRLPIATLRILTY